MNHSVFQELAVSFTGDTTGLAAAAAEAARLLDGVAGLAAPAAGGLDAVAIGGLAGDAAPGLGAAADALLGAAEALGLAADSLAHGAGHDAPPLAPLLIPELETPQPGDGADLSAEAGAAAPLAAGSPPAVQAAVTNNITQNTTLKTDIEDPEKAALKLIAPLDRLIQERAGLGIVEAVRQVSLMLAGQGAR